MLKRNCQILIGFLLSLVGIVLLVYVANQASAATITVDDDGDGEYDTIQDAIDAAGEGDTIRVWEGTYYENVVVNKMVSLVGNGSEETTIDGGGEEDVVIITADWVNITGFTVTGSGDGSPDSGIRVESDQNLILENNCSNNFNGVYLWYSSNCKIENNTCSDNGFAGISLFESSNCTIANNSCNSNYGYGIRPWYTNGCIITNNTCLNNGNGIRLYHSCDCTITNNKCSNNVQGIFLGSSSACTILNNTMNKNSIMIEDSLIGGWNSHTINSINTVNGNPVYYYKNTEGFSVPSGAGQVILANCTLINVENQNCSDGSVGITVGFSSHITLSNNTCLNNWHGIYLESSSDCMIINNTCSNNSAGISLTSTSTCTVTNNTCSNNTGTFGEGIHIGYSDHCTISNNVCSNNNNGIYLWYSNNCTGINNVCWNNNKGIDLFSSHNNNLTGNTADSNYQYGISLRRSSNNSTITDNSISKNEVGIYLRSSARDNVVNNNDIYNNMEYGIDASDNNEYTVSATNNWWGHESGPYHPVSNSLGIGDNVTDHVEFDPWTGKEDDPEPYYGPEWYVDDDASVGGNGSEEKPFNRIQHAIDNATEGDTIRVWEGTYYENVVVDKSMSLEGNGSETTTIDGGGSGDVVQITADWVNMSGFFVTGSGDEWGDSGISVESNHNKIFKNNCLSNYSGLHLADSSNCMIENNICNSNKYYGILLVRSEACTITNNTCENNNHGIVLGPSSNDCTLENNTCSSNSGSGISLHSTSYCILENNTCFSNNNYGISLYYYSSDNTIKNNTCKNNGYGIYIDESNACSIENSTISENGVGIYLLTSSEGNTAHYNKIFNNTEYGIDATGNNGHAINAMHNWWGDASGPYHPTENSEGKGDNMTDNVEFDPWFLDPGFGEEVNRPPEAFIDSISPNPAIGGEFIRFVGHGTDDGSIISYAWRSTIDGELYNDTESELDHDGLSNGTHTIYFKAQDNHGIWSDEVSDTLTVNGKPQAFIDSISPNPAVEEESIGFEGQGIDDGTIVRYFWGSNIDSELYNDTDPSFSLSNLSNGSHTIYLKVMDNYGVWSDEVSTTLGINGLPRAHIDSVAPNPAEENQIVTITGSGTDDGTIAHFIWRSSLDGPLYNGTSPIFSLSNLSAGNHTIFLMVQDNSGVWSDEVTVALEVKEKSVPENQKPTVTITTPTDGKTIKDTITISGTASDPDGMVQKVELSINGENWTTLTGITSWSFEWDTKDYCGNQGLSFLESLFPPARNGFTPLKLS